MAPRPHIQGLDTFRFFAALWEALSHGAAFPLKAVWAYLGPVVHVFIGIYDCLFNGVAAVIVFFVTSGRLSRRSARSSQSAASLDCFLRTKMDLLILGETILCRRNER